MFPRTKEFLQEGVHNYQARLGPLNTVARRIAIRSLLLHREV